VPPWPRLFHSMRATRQTELEREFPLHVGRAWLGNFEAVAKMDYRRGTDEDITRASGGQVRYTKTSQQEAARIDGQLRKTMFFLGFLGISGMEDRGLEPLTFCMPCKRSPN
jgi:hypothetical protein